jgi:hypothetical protein
VKRIRVCDAAVAVLTETNNPAVMWGDTGLLHMIAKRAGLPSKGRAWMTEDAVLRALSRQPGSLIAGLTRGPSEVRGRRVRIFWLPGYEPERMRATKPTKMSGANGQL